jgi:GNAT superfamily N-acetyltransferase
MLDRTHVRHHQIGTLGGSRPGAVAYGRAVIRTCRPDDVPEILRLVRELADYEREPESVEASESSLYSALFGHDSFVHAFVGEADGQVVGLALWFLAFSTWTGRPTLYLEDLVVSSPYRGSGMGRALMAALAGEARRRGCARMDWSVLNWNEPSIAFYRRLGAEPMSEWTGWRLSGPALEALAGP